jgi:hypothetical protein
VRFKLDPPGIVLHEDGSFRLTLIRMPMPDVGGAELPTVFVEHPGYAPVRLDLEAAASRQAGKRVVQLDTVVFRPRPALATHEH